MMKKIRRRFKQMTTFRSRVEAFACDMLQQAEGTHSAALTKALLRQADKADAAIDIDEWISGHKDRPELLEAVPTKISQRSLG